MSTDILPISNAPLLYANNGVISYVGNTTFAVSAGQFRDATNTNDIKPAAATVNSAITGAGGLDTGVLLASKCYAVHAIKDPYNYHPDAYMFSLSATAPTLPFGYGEFVRVGWVFTDSSVHFIKLYVSGNGSTRSYKYDSAISVLNAGGSSSAAVDLSNVVPAVNKLSVLFVYDYLPHAAGEIARVYPSASTGSVLDGITGQVASVHITGQLEVDALLISGAPKVDYSLSVTTSPAALTLYVRGFTDSI